MAETVDVWQWRYFDPARNKHFKSLHMTEEEVTAWAAKEGYDLKERLTWSLQKRVLEPATPQSLLGHSSAVFMPRGAPGTRE